MEQMRSDHRTPGQLIADLLEAKGWTKRVLAIVLGADETGINRLVADKRQVTAEMALALEDVFEVPADRFLKLQKDYDLAKALYLRKAGPGKKHPRPADWWSTSRGDDKAWLDRCL